MYKEFVELFQVISNIYHDHIDPISPCCDHWSTPSLSFWIGYNSSSFYRTTLWDHIET